MNVTELRDKLNELIEEGKGNHEVRRCIPGQFGKHEYRSVYELEEIELYINDYSKYKVQVLS